MKNILANILYRLWCKDVSLMLYGLKHLNFKIFFDWIAVWKYKYIWNVKEWLIFEFAKRYKDYLWKDSFKNKLILWLDNESINTVNQIEKNIKIVLNRDNSKPYVKKSDCWIVDDDIKIKKYIEKYKKDIFLPIDYHSTTSFFYKHWIKYIKNLNKILKWKDILDCWAYIWDSAMMFSKELWFLPDGGIINHIYCLEPDLTNSKLLKDTIKENHKEWKIIHIPLGVWNKKEKLYFNSNWSNSVVEGLKKDKNGYSIEIDTIDHIVENYWMKPGLIKRDIEWMEYESILWAEKTIKKYKPILLISIYHNWKDFYTIKPLIESRNLWYNFMIRHLSNDLFFETMLICY